MEQSSRGTVVQGWVLLHPDLQPLADDPQVVASLTPQVELVHPQNVSRPDVIANVFHQDPEDHPQRCCGFQFVVPNHVTSFQLSLRLGKQQVKLAKVRFEAICNVPNPSSGVLEGKSGWLFLGNDTNHSMDQHSGAMQLTRRGLRSWVKYTKGLQRFGRTIQAPVALLIAPAKESVLGQYHPLAAGDQNPVQQVADVLPRELVVHPVAAMKELGDDAFLVTDTHWSDQGARVAAVELAKTLGLDSQDVVNLFANDRYRSEQIVGDLGCKLTPPRTSLTQRLDSYDLGDDIVYDNGLRSFGRIFVTRNTDALVDQTCLIFGSSSSYAMLKYSSRLFGCVILVHTAGSLDPHLIAAVKPQYLVVQTNARFVVRVPLLTYSVRDHLKKKISEFSAAQRADAIANRVCTDEAWLADSALAPYDQILS
ncbi:alginate O-acetyltransferase AlgX-related protein [Novipirellula sp. SH528]|uniref:alginate O-acetyltransferase AlgX-related protein n=1 Tax=Novipirellula sp. SH528 TaxID=3454466 RepID=UPI003FA0C857